MKKNMFNKVIRVLAYKGFFNFVPDKIYLKLLYKANMGKKLDLNHPGTFNEKLQWLKLYDRNPKYTRLVDKYEVKKIVADTIGEEYIIPTLGVWDCFDDIDFDTLPEKFVLKSTHDSGGLVICKDKKKFDKKKAKEKIDKSLKYKYYYLGREWPYKDVTPRIIAEQYMEDDNYHDLRDYKFFCFNGQVIFLFIATERQNPNEDTKFDFFDENFNHLPFVNGHPNAEKEPPKPSCFDEMKELASKLSVGIPQVRVDFYEVNGKIYFGEMTFFHWSGMVPFDPPEWDEYFGEYIDLSLVDKK